MKIIFSWIPPGATNPSRFIACTTAEIAGASLLTNGLTDYAVNGESIIKEAKFFRALQEKFYDRGNEKTVVTFTVSWGWPDIVAAETWLNLYNTKFPRIASVQFQSSTSGKSASTYLVNAAIHPASSKLKGCTTYHTHRIEGGIMTTRPN